MSYDATILATTGLANYWKLDEASGTTAADAFGASPLTYAGGVTYSTAAIVAGGIRAKTFDRATSGRVSMATSPTGAANTSYEFWFRPSDLATDRQCILFNGAGGNGFGLCINGGSVNGHLYYLRQSLAWHDTGVAPLTTRPSHVVLTLDGSANPRVYHDGLLAFTGSGAPDAPSGGFIIGAEVEAGGNGFNGVIDDVSTYTVALDAATILAHYQAGTAPPIAPLASNLYRRRRAG